MSRDLPRLLLTVCEAARVLRISRAKTYELVRAGALPARKIGARTVVHWRDLEAFADKLPLKVAREEAAP